MILRPFTAVVFVAALTACEACESPAVTSEQPAPATASADADTAARSALAVIDSLGAALRRRDTAALRALFVPGTPAVIVVPNDDVGRIELLHLDDAIGALAAAPAALDERLDAPRVSVDGPVASVWARYSFFLRDSVIHCGRDAFGLVRTAQGWRIASSVYTVQPPPCAAAASE